MLKSFFCYYFRMNLIEIGKGAYGRVYYYKSRGHRYAVKHYNSNVSINGLSDDALKDIIVYMKLANITVHDLQVTDHRLSLIMNYYREHMATYRSDLGILHLKHIFYSVLHTLSRIHQHGIIHRDIKPQNILSNDGCHGKLIDYGISSLSQHIDFTREVYTPWYRPPEVTSGESYDCSADIWALGITIMEIFTGKPVIPHDSHRADELQSFQNDLENLQNDHFQYGKYRYVCNLIKVKEPVLFDLLAAMLAKKPAERPTAEQCMDHKWFKTVEINLPPSVIVTNQITLEITDSALRDDVMSVCNVLDQSYKEIIEPEDPEFLTIIANSLYIYYSYVSAKPSRKSGMSLTIAVHMTMKLLSDKYSKSVLKKITSNYHYELDIIQTLSGNLLFKSVNQKTLIQYLLNHHYWKTQVPADIEPLSASHAIKKITKPSDLRYLIKND